MTKVTVYNFAAENETKYFAKYAILIMNKY